MIAKRVEQRVKGRKSSASRLIKYMVNAKGGQDPRSWEKTADYILDNAENQLSTGEKLLASSVTNCGTDDPVAATLLIQATQAVNTRSKSDKTYHLVFSFPPGENPNLETLSKIEDELCTEIGYADHQRISAVHQDTDNLHVHVCINKVHPTGYQNIEPYFDKKRLMDACERLEVEHGLHRTNHGKQQEQEHERDTTRSVDDGRFYGRDNGRERGAERGRTWAERGRNRADGKGAVRGAGTEPRTIRLNTEQRRTDSIFARQLRESYHIEYGEKRPAKSLNDLRVLSGSGLVNSRQGARVLLPGDAPEKLQPEGRGDGATSGVRRPRHGDRGAGIEDDAKGSSGEQSRVLSPRIIEIEEQSGIEQLAGFTQREAGNQLKNASSWQELHDTLSEFGLTAKLRGAGLVIGDKSLDVWCKASQVDRELSLGKLSTKLGDFKADKKAASTKTPKKRYAAKPIHESPHTSQLYAQYQRDQQIRMSLRRAGMAEIKEVGNQKRQEISAWAAAQRKANKMGKGAAKKINAGRITSQTQSARADLSKRLSQRRASLVAQTPHLSWADWLKQEAQAGNTTALAVLRSREQKESQYRGDLLRVADAQRVSDVVFKNLKPNVQKNGSVVYRTVDGGRVTDTQTQIEASEPTAAAALVALKLASERFDGHKLIVEGSEQFKSDVARLAAIHKIDVQFSDPAMQQAFTKEAAQAVPQAKTSVSPDPTVKTDGVDNWIKDRNAMQSKIYSSKYIRRWQPTDSGDALYQGKRKMADGQEVLLFKKGDDLLVKPSTSRVVAKASKLKKGTPVQLDARGRLTIKDQDKGMDL